MYVYMYLSLHVALPVKKRVVILHFLLLIVFTCSTTAYSALGGGAAPLFLFWTDAKGIIAWVLSTFTYAIKAQEVV